MAESVGELLGGRYRLLGERASFPFGAWWEAEDDQGARTVVLRMNAEVADPAAKAKRAVTASGSIDSAHIVPWADGGVDDKGHGWLAAPMFGPWSLTEHVSRGEGIPPAEAAPLVHQLARAVAAAEAAGVVHNTLTSEFVRLVPLTEGGYGVKVYGFGLADLLPSFKPLRKQDAYLGVPDYMSPELCAGKAAEGSSADIYALGIIMYEAVRGRPPFAPTFASASASTTLKRHIFEKPLPLHVRYANAPFIKTYENICFKALAKTANRRQLTVAELEKELESLIVDEMRSQVVSLAAVSGRGPTTSRRLRTQVIAQIPVEEPKVEVPAAKPAAVEVKVAEPAPEPVAEKPVARPVERAPAEAAPEEATSIVVAADLESHEVVEAAHPRRGDSTLVFAGLGPAVRELAEAARKAPDDDEDGSSEDEAEPANAGPITSSQPRVKGKKGKKGRRASTGAPVVSNSAATEQAPRPTPAASAVVPTSPSSATIITSKVETATNERDATAANAKVEPSGAKIKKKEDTIKAPRALTPSSKSPSDEEWFAEDEANPKKSSRMWILLLLVAVVVVVVVILLMRGGDEPKEPVGGVTVPGSRYAMESEGLAAPRAGEAPPTPEPQPTLTASAPAATPPSEPAKTEPPAPTPEPPKPAAAPEPPKPEPTAAPEPPKPEPTAAPQPPKNEPAALTAPITPTPVKLEPTRVEPVKDEPKLEPTRVETAKNEPKVEPTRVEPKKIEPKNEPPKVESKKDVEPAPVTPKNDPPGSPEDQFRQKAKHYIELGVAAYKGENYKLAIGYFKKAQEADPTNSLAARYLKQAVEKSGTP